MTLHVFGPAFSTLARSVRLYCEEKGLAYTHGLVLDGVHVQLRSPEHMSLHPFGKVPVLLDGEARVFETTSICRYLDAAFPDTSLQPSEPLLRAEVDQWSGALALYIDEVLIRGYLLLVASPVLRAPPTPSAIAEAADAVAEIFKLLERRIEGRKNFFCGANYSMADAILTPMLDYLQQLPASAAWFKENAQIADYLQRMRDRPSARAVLTPPGRM
ncbi:glutathione S-transferase family protein [Pseudomonas stutzeri]|uniref:glutathione S-transferase family protein n=1 Tax=Stutzerimonas stutzeri TaxID=316 RepID=UPI00210D6CF8|nr:glutathione S-transferase family protein [Stutzerimonas stutzeri]MCQ4287596.1 glutathione S-transferase family protein [Stutzerimonas stutzeri]